jgi:hypothetical protein
LIKGSFGLGCVQKPNKPKPKEPFIKENDVTFCIYYLHPEHKSIHHTKRQHFLTDTQKLKDTLQSSPQHSAILHDKCLFFYNLKPPTPKHTGKIQTQRLLPMPSRMEMKSSHRLIQSDCIFKAGGSEHHLSKVCQLLHTDGSTTSILQCHMKN